MRMHQTPVSLSFSITLKVMLTFLYYQDVPCSKGLKAYFIHHTRNLKRSVHT